MRFYGFPGDELVVLERDDDVGSAGGHGFGGDVETSGGHELDGQVTLGVGVG